MDMTMQARRTKPVRNVSVVKTTYAKNNEGMDKIVTMATCQGRQAAKVLILIELLY